MRKKTSNLLIVVITALLAGLFAGVMGEILARNYMFENMYGIPFSDEWDLSNTGFNRSNVVIEGAKKIVVEQNERIDQVNESARNNIAGIFPKKETIVESNAPTSTAGAIDADKFYDLGKEHGQALILTGDGWMVTDVFADTNTPVDPEKYVIITNDHRIRELDEIITDTNNELQFLHIKDAQGLPVKSLADKDNTKTGSTVMLLDWPGNTLVTSIANNNNYSLVRSSEKVNASWGLANSPGEEHLHPSFIFDLNENIVGLLNSQGKLVPADELKRQLNSLLEFQEIKRPMLGINYIDLADVALPGEQQQGALIYPPQDGMAVIEDSPADQAGLRAGDIITAVNNQKIDEKTGLSSAVQGHLPEDKINILYQRNGEEHSTIIELSELQ